MQAIRLLAEKKDGKHPLKAVGDAPIPTLLKGRREVLVKIEAAAMNHRDNWMTMGLYPRMKYGGIIGSDGCGVVIAVSDEEDNNLVGKRVVSDAAVKWGSSERGPDPSFNILGMPLDGTFAEFVRIPAANIHLAPSHLTSEQCAAIPLAGATAYRALVTKGDVSQGSTVLITGIGGGVALFALQFAVALGCKVFVTSGSNDKLKKACEMGACYGVNYRTKGWEVELKKRIRKDDAGFDCVIDGAGGPAVTQIMRLMKPGGRFVTYGATAGSPKSIPLPSVFLPNIEIRGTAMASPTEVESMIKLIEQQKIVPVVDKVFHFHKIDVALERMRKSGQFGKIVLVPSPQKAKL